MPGGQSPLDKGSAAASRSWVDRWLETCADLAEQVVERQDDHMIADAYAAVFPAKTTKIVAAHSYHLFVFRL